MKATTIKEITLCYFKGSDNMCPFLDPGAWNTLRGLQHAGCSGGSGGRAPPTALGTPHSPLSSKTQGSAAAAASSGSCPGQASRAPCALLRASQISKLAELLHNGIGMD